MCLNLLYVNSLPEELKKYILQFVQINKCKNCKSTIYFNDYCDKFCQIKYKIKKKLMLIGWIMIWIFFILHTNFVKEYQEHIFV